MNWLRRRRKKGGGSGGFVQSQGTETASSRWKTREFAEDSTSLPFTKWCSFSPFAGWSVDRDAVVLGEQNLTMTGNEEETHSQTHTHTQHPSHLPWSSQLQRHGIRLKAEQMPSLYNFFFPPKLSVILISSTQKEYVQLKGGCSTLQPNAIHSELQWPMECQVRNL